jgi:hypothetical protein
MRPSDWQTQMRNDDHPAGIGVRRLGSALWAWRNECVRRNLVRATGCSVPPRDIRWIQRPQPAPGWGRFSGLWRGRDSRAVGCRPNRATAGLARADCPIIAGGPLVLQHEPFGPRAGQTPESREVRAIAPGLVERDRHRFSTCWACRLLFRRERIKQEIQVCSRSHG